MSLQIFEAFCFSFDLELCWETYLVKIKYNWQGKMLLRVKPLNHHSFIQSVSQSVNQPASHSVSQSTNQPVIHLFSQPTSQPANQPASQSVSQSFL